DLLEDHDLQKTTWHSREIVSSLLRKILGLDQGLMQQGSIKVLLTLYENFLVCILLDESLKQSDLDDLHVVTAHLLTAGKISTGQQTGTQQMTKAPNSSDLFKNLLQIFIQCPLSIEERMVLFRISHLLDLISMKVSKTSLGNSLAFEWNPAFEDQHGYFTILEHVLPSCMGMGNKMLFQLSQAASLCIKYTKCSPNSEFLKSSTVSLLQASIPWSQVACGTILPPSYEPEFIRGSLDWVSALNEPVADFKKERETPC
ncbi:unnamed protein product, partial [Darwinula stevensoni]